MTARPRLVAGNWKMHLFAEEARQLALGVVETARERPDVEVAVFPPFTALHPVRAAVEGSPVLLGAQTCHSEPKGAHTGEVSAPMLADAGCHIVLVGHSERRAAGETDEAVRARVRAVLDAGLRALVCVGETLAECEAARTDEVLVRQVSSALFGLTAADLASLDLAYEPVWAIGTGRNATPETASAAHARIRALLVEKFGEAGRGPRILYGGSVKPGNAREIMAAPGVQGVLVGGASLDAAAFREIVRSA